MRGRRIGLRASVGQTQGSPCVKAPGSWRIAAAELSRCVCLSDVAVCASRPKAHALPLTDERRGRAPHRWRRSRLHPGAAEDARTMRPLATCMAAAPATSQRGGVDPAGSPRAVHGWQAERWCIRAHEQCSAMATTCPYVAARATGTSATMVEATVEKIESNTKTSEPPPSGAIKPYPRSVLKNLTRPLGIAHLIRFNAQQTPRPA